MHVRRKKNCKVTGKISYGDEIDAKMALTKRQTSVKDGRREQRVYPCGYCGWWHLTSQSRGRLL